MNNYLVWQTVQALTQFLSKAYREAYKGLRKALLGSEGSEESWRYCVSDTNSAIGYAIGAMFVREMFQQDSKETVRAPKYFTVIFKTLKYIFYKLINSQYLI